MKKNKKRNTIIVLVSFLVISIICINLFWYQKPLFDTIASDDRNSGITLFAHMEYYVNPNTLVFDIWSVDHQKRPADVFRVLLQYAEKMQDKSFSKVKLASKGKIKFIIDGKYFQKLGQEYSFQNPIYTMRTFPENVYLSNGKKPFSEWTGGALGVLTRQLEDFNEMNMRWYIEDMK